MKFPIKTERQNPSSDVTRPDGGRLLTPHTTLKNNVMPFDRRFERFFSLNF